MQAPAARRQPRAGGPSCAPHRGRWRASRRRPRVRRVALAEAGMEQRSSDLYFAGTCAKARLAKTKKELFVGVNVSCLAG